jgi:CMP/dCMP kinase
MINKPHFDTLPPDDGQPVISSSSGLPHVPYQPAIVVTIDGPAGAGKSTVARMLAERLGFDFLDTGAMYRCVTLAARRAGIDTADATLVRELAEGLSIELSGTQVVLNGQDVSAAIRAPEVSTSIKAIADNVAVRRTLTELQRRWTEGRYVVTEGRDQGSEVFPDAPCKIFLVASSQERARRRCRELADRGEAADFDAILSQQNQRDSEDRSRPVGSLRKAAGSIEFCTDGKPLEQVVSELLAIVVNRLTEHGIDVSQARSAPHHLSTSQRTEAAAGRTSMPGGETL